MLVKEIIQCAHALQYIFLTLPSKAYLLFAPAVLLGSLLGLGAMASNSELTVMRAAGISNGRIIRAVLMTGVALMLLNCVARRNHHAESRANCRRDSLNRT